MLSRTVQILRDLIAIPSVNPMLVGHVEGVEGGVADYIENALKHARIDCERQRVEDGRENIIALVEASHSRGFKSDGLMLCSHMDTVPVANMSIDPFDPVMRGGRIYGRGACDAKGPIAAMLAALMSHAGESGRRSTIMFAATVNEEFSFTGAWKLIEREWPVSAGIVGEPTNLAAIIAHKGVVRWRIKVKGTSAHGATPEMGRSAIYDGARVALALEDYASELRIKRTPHPLLGRPTINLGRVTGGQAVNVVPDACELEVERRLLPGEDGIEEVRACASGVRERVASDIEVSFDDPYLVDPALDTPRDAEVVRALDAAHQSLFGEPVEIKGAHYGTDGSKLSRAGIETVICGPGDIAQAHTKDEFIEIEQLEMAARLYQSLIADWPRTLK